MLGSRVLASATLIAIAAGALPAAEMIGGFVDMRLGGGITGGSYDLNVSDNTGAVLGGGEYDDEFDDNYRITLNWVGSLGLRSYGGWIWGIGGTYNNRSGTELTYTDEAPATETVTTDDVDFHAWSADGFIGYAVPIGENFQIEVLPFIGTGRAYLETPANSGNLSDAADTYTEAGVNVNAVLTFDNGFQIGATAGYWWWETSIIVDHIEQDNLADPDGVRFKFESWDFNAAFFIGIRL